MKCDVWMKKRPVVIVCYSRAKLMWLLIKPRAVLFRTDVEFL